MNISISFLRLQERKTEQDQKLKGRLEDMKRKRAESRIGPPDLADDTKHDRKEKSDSKSTSERKDKSSKGKQDSKANEQKQTDNKASDYDFTIY